MQRLPVTGTLVPHTFVEEYEIELEGNVPRGCIRDSLKVWTPRADLGWRFAIARDDTHFQPDGDGSDLDVFFDTCTWQFPKGNTRLGVCRGQRDQEDGFTWEWQDVSEGVTRILSFSRNTVPDKPMIRFAVTTLLNPSAALSKPKPEPLWTALNFSLKTTKFSDTLFYAFSKKGETGGVCEPKSVAANSGVLKLHSNYFANLLGNEFVEKDDTTLQNIPTYDYDSDSDMEEWDETDEPEEEEEEEKKEAEPTVDAPHVERDPLPFAPTPEPAEPVPVPQASVAAPTTAEAAETSAPAVTVAQPAQPVPAETPVPEAAVAVAPVEASAPAPQTVEAPASTAEESIVQAVDAKPPEEATASVAEVKDEAKASNEDSAVPPSPTAGLLPSSPADVKHVLLVRDMSFLTWQAMVFYLYTGHVSFAPLRSSSPQKRRAFIRKYAKEHPDRPLPCSPKSMFRLADKLGLEGLADTAFEALQAHTNDDNVIAEFFTSYTNRYDRVQQFFLEYLRQHSKSKTIQDALAAKAEEIKDQFPDLLFAAFRKLIV